MLFRSVNYVLNGLNPQVTKQVQDAVEGKLQQLGWKVSPSSSKTVTVKIETGKPGEVEYHTARGFGPVPIVPPPGFGIPPGSGPGIKVQYTPWIHTLSISVNGQEVHLSQYQRGAPSYLETKDGESTQEGVLRYCQPFPDYFKNLPIPPHLLKFEYKQGLGASTIDASGLH